MTEPLDRREFLARAVLTAGALALPRAAGATQAGAPAIPNPAGMFVSLPPWAVARNVGWPEQAHLAARVGYKGLDWAFGPAKAAGPVATRALFAGLGLVPTIVNLPVQNALGIDDAAFAAALPKLAEDAAFCQAIGCSRFQLVLGATTPNQQGKADRWLVVRQRLNAIGETIAKHEMRLGLEFLGPLMFRRARRPANAPPADPAAPPPPPPVPFVWTLPETLALCEASAPNVGVTLDAWHWYHSGGTVADIRAAKAARIVHVHVSDAKPMPPEEVRDDMRWLPGEGVIDLVGFFQALKAIGYQGGVAPETIGSRIPADMAPEESARQALAATTAVMQRSGVT